MWSDGAKAQAYWTGRGYDKPYKVPAPWWRRAAIFVLWNIGQALDRLERTTFIEDQKP